MISKERQISLAKYNLKRMGENPRDYDLKAIFDSKLTFSENWKILKKEYGLKSRKDRRIEKRKYIKGFSNV